MDFVAVTKLQKMCIILVAMMFVCFIVNGCGKAPEPKVVSQEEADRAKQVRGDAVGYGDSLRV